jgi:hypothetical protein
VVAIGDPRTERKLAPLGAARDFERDDTWQQKAIDLMRRSSMIVAVVGQTEGFLWEINTIIKLGLRSKLVLLLPPVRAQELAPRWDALVHHVKGMAFLEDIDLTRMRAVALSPDGVVFIVGDKGNDWTYETVLDTAAELILATEPPGTI